MLLIALLVLPLFAVEHFWQKQIEASPMLADLTAIATGFIWFAFTLEFIIMISIEQKRLDYCRKHWIDLAVICLPMIAFLRAFRMAGLLKSARMFRLKSLVMKLYRAALMLDVINRLLQRNPEKRITRLESILLEKEREINAIKTEIAILSDRIASNPLSVYENTCQDDTPSQKAA
jgi:voltage-gated potassium channel